MFDINSCYDCFSTEPNSAYFGSGLGENGQDIAELTARKDNGTTLEMLMEKNKDKLISAGFSYDEDLEGFCFTKDNAQDWQAISQAYAEQASGNIHVVLGDNDRENSVWNTMELTALKNNEDVNKVISVEPLTGKEKDILLDKTTCESTSPIQHDISSETIDSINGGGQHAPPKDSRDIDLKDLGVDSTKNTASGVSNNLVGGIT